MRTYVLINDHYARTTLSSATFPLIFPFITLRKNFKISLARKLIRAKSSLICIARKLIRAKLYQNHSARKFVRAKISTNKVIEKCDFENVLKREIL